jgi:hypothetical protein
MGRSLGYNFEKTHIKDTCYYPEAHGDIATDNFVIRKKLVELLTAKASLPMFITNIPAPHAGEPPAERHIANCS